MVNYYIKAARGAIFIFSTSMLANFFGYLSRGLLSRTLSQADFGLFYAILTFFYFVALPVDFGFGPANIKFISHFRALKNYRSLYSTFVVGAGIKLFLSVIASVIILLAAPYLANNYFKSPAALPALGFVALYIILGTILGLFSDMFVGFQKMYSAGMLYLAQKLFFFLAALGFILFSQVRGVMMPVYAFTICSIVFIFFPVQIMQVFSKFKFKLNITWGLIKRLFKFAFSSMINSAGYIVIGYIDVMMLTFYRTLSEVGVYNAVLPTALILTYLASSMGAVLFPIASELWTKKAGERLAKGIELLYDYLLFITLPAAILLMIFPELILSTLFGGSYATGASALRLLSFGVILASLFKINSTVLNGIGRPQDVTITVLPAAAFNFLANLYAIPHFGISGAALVTSLSYLIMLLISIIYVMKNTSFKFPWRRISVICINGVIFALLVLVIKARLPLTGLMGAFVSVSVSGLVYLGLGLLLRIINLKEILELNPLKKG